MTLRADDADRAVLTFTIRQLAALAGVTPRAVRHYEQVGLLPPARRGSNHLLYDVGQLAQLLKIKRLSELGLPLKEVSTVMADPTSPQSVQILMDLDQALADQAAEVRRQRQISASC